jgi:hypothetical protein
MPEASAVVLLLLLACMLQRLQTAHQQSVFNASSAQLCMPVPLARLK